jgi:hypothetical protein
MERAFINDLHRLLSNRDKPFPIVNALRSQLSWTRYRSLISIDNPKKMPCI